MMALTECFRYTVTVNGFYLFQLMVISVTVTVNLNHTGRRAAGVGGASRGHANKYVGWLN